METHEFARIAPEMAGEAFAELCASVKEHGLREPIVLLDDAVLDGRHRWRACSKVGVKPIFRKFGSRPSDGDDPLAFVLDMNVNRRHLDESQRALIGSRVATLRRGGDRRSEAFKGQNYPLKTEDAAKLRRGGKGGSHTEGDRQNCLSQQAAAKLVRVSPKLIKAARKVLEKGSPELVRAVEQGRVAVSAAQSLVSLPRKAQVAITQAADQRTRRTLIADAKRAAREQPKEPPPRELVLEKTSGKGRTKMAMYSVDEWSALSPGTRADIIALGFEATGQGMNEQTTDSIEWARFSHNTVTGCLHPCPYCYARDMAQKFPRQFEPTFHPNRLAGPGSVLLPKRAEEDPSYRNVFANSMSDLFGSWVPEDWILATIDMARRNPQWNFLTLTKFPNRAADFDFPDNWWMGTTVDAQVRVAVAEAAFLKVRCKTKWLSVEPMLEPLTFKRLDIFQWVVIGGASASRRLPAWSPPFEWVARLHLAAKDAGCKVYYKTNYVYERTREFPWVATAAPELPRGFRYLKGM